MRRDKFCPECDFMARPTLMNPPPVLYVCEGCGAEMPRTSLVEKKYNRLALAGSGGSGSPFTLTMVGNAIDNTGGASVNFNTTFARALAADEVLLVFLASLTNDAAATSVVLNGSDSMTLLEGKSGVAFGSIGLEVFGYSGAFTVPGIQQVNANWAVTAPTEIAFASAVLKGVNTTKDKSASSVGAGTTFASGAAGTTTAVSEYLIGSLWTLDASAISANSTFPSGVPWELKQRSSPTTSLLRLDVWGREISGITNPRFEGSENGSASTSLASIVTFKRA